MYVPFSEMPDHARVWFYQCDRAMTVEEVEVISAFLLNFTEQWTAHQNDLKASFTVLYDRFIILTVDERQAGASGCSIDSSVRAIQGIEKELNLSLFDRTVIHYRDGEGIGTMNLSAFQEALASGQVTDETIVFNNMVESVGDLNQNWEVPVKHSWHSQLMA